MLHEWSPLATSRYQDHVIAHVVGATGLGYFIIDDAAYVLLDIALIWTIYTSGEMALMPQAVVISDLEVDEDVKMELYADAERLHRGETEEPLARMSPMPEGCLVGDVKIYARGERRRVVVEAEETGFAVESLPALGEIRVLELKAERF